MDFLCIVLFWAQRGGQFVEGDVVFVVIGVAEGFGGDFLGKAVPDREPGPSQAEGAHDVGDIVWVDIGVAWKGSRGAMR